MSEFKLVQIIEAALLSASRPLSLEEIERLFEEEEKPSKEDLRNCLRELEELCNQRGVELKLVSSGYRLQVRQELSRYIAKIWEEKPQKFSKATLETLSLIAYRQPITRGEIEEIRGVSIGSQLIRSLLERGWIKVIGHKEVPGRPCLYSTTKIFLDYFGLQNLRELPDLPGLPDPQSLDMELPLDQVTSDDTSSLEATGTSET